MYLSELGPDCGEIGDDQAERIVFQSAYESATKSDCMIVLGTDPRYAAIRAVIAASLYRKSGTERIICSGGAVWDNTVTEASVLRKELGRLGVPAENISEEPSARDTKQNMTCSLALLSRLTDIAHVGSVVIVTEPFHMRRSLCLAKLLLPAYFCISGYTEKTFEQRMRWRTDERLRVCVKGELRAMRELILQGRMQDIELR